MTRSFKLEVFACIEAVEGETTLSGGGTDKVRRSEVRHVLLIPRPWPHCHGSAACSPLGGKVAVGSPDSLRPS